MDGLMDSMDGFLFLTSVVQASRICESGAPPQVKTREINMATQKGENG